MLPLERVIRLSQRHPVLAASVCIALGEASPGQLHIGILHRASTGPATFLHLAWHCRLQNEPIIPDYISHGIRLSIRAERLQQIAALCRRIARKNSVGGIPYAFSAPSAAFDTATGAFLIGPSRFGLTCASFVLAVFHAAGLPLVDYASWPMDRPGDRAWQERIVELLASRADAQHLEHVRSEIGAVRYRPEEVAAAATSAPPPVGFALAEPLGGRAIVAKLRQDAEAA